MKIVPIFQRQAKEFIARHHRHNIPSLVSVFNVGIESHEGELIGVAMTGIPKSRMLMDGITLEVTRVCVLENNRNANSMLYGACARAAKALGYSRLITYTLESESGISLRAAGWTADTELRTHDINGWKRRPNSVDLFGHERMPAGPKVRWFLELNSRETAQIAKKKPEYRAEVTTLANKEKAPRGASSNSRVDRQLNQCGINPIDAAYRLQQPLLEVGREALGNNTEERKPNPSSVHP